MFVTTLALVLAMSTPQVADLPLDTTELEPAGSWPFGDGTTIVMDTTRHLVCMAAGCGVFVVDVTDPVRPKVLSDRIRCQSEVWNMWLDGSRLYLAMATYLFVPSVERDVEVWDIADAARPVRLGSIDLTVSPTAVWARNNLMLVSCYRQFLSYNVADPGYPVLLDSVAAYNPAYRITVRDTFAFLSVGLGGVGVYSVADPGNLRWLGEWGNFNMKEPGMAVEGDRLYQVAMPSQGSSCGLRIYDITDPLNGQLLGAFDTMPYASPYRLVVRDTIAAVAYRGAGLRLVSVADPVHPYEIAAAGDACRDVVWVDTLAYVAGGSRLEIVNLADPSWPVVVASLPTRQAGNGVALIEDAVLSIGSGLTVLGDDSTGDLTSLARLDTPASVSRLSAFDTVAVAQCYNPDGLVVYGLGDREHPTLLATELVGICTPLLADTLCYVSTTTDFRVYSLANPRFPLLLGSVPGSWGDEVTLAADSLALVGTVDLSV
ncbi:MAG: hypothetical protein NTX53_03345, partial [candidate division WOR-3 bacterium]|nr:hypothetical protein [candidate division WOR-3 bacterium]